MAITPASAARLTPAGRGAIAVIRAEGATADWNADGLFRAASGGAWCELPLDKPLFGRWGRDVAEDVVVCRLSMSSFEVQCHAGEAAVQRILADLQEQGFATVDAAAQTPRGDELEDELQAALQHCHTWRAANVLLEQSSGVLRAAFERLRNIAWTEAECSAAMGEIERLLDWSALGVHLSQPWSVVLTGRPNVGKSSLLNALLGFQRAIVAAVPGTTRDVVTGLTAFDGWPVELSDTAGLRETNAELEAAGMALARDRLAAADCRLVLIDISTPPHSADFQLLSTWPNAIVVAHKADLPDFWNDRLPVGAIRVSSLAGEGIDLLIAAIVRQLAPHEPPPGTAVPVTPRQVQLLHDLQRSLQRNDEPAYRHAVDRLFDGGIVAAGNC